MTAPWPYENDQTDLEITHEYGEDTAVDVVSTMPCIDGGTGEPMPVVVRKPRP